MTPANQLTVRGVAIDVVRKDIKNLHLGVYPPSGRVRVAAPATMPDDAIRAAVVSRWAWVARNRARYQHTPRQTPREYVSGETHYLFGHRYRLRVDQTGARGSVETRGKATLVMQVPEGSTLEYRRNLMDRWTRQQLAHAAAPLLDEWSTRMGLNHPVTLHLRRMRTRWATVNENSGRLTLNTEAVRQPLESIELLIVHELGHFHTRGHGSAWIAHMDHWLPNWRERQARLDSATLSHEVWHC